MAFSFFDFFSDRQPIIAMIHVPALPGTPAAKGNWSDVLKAIEREACLLRDAGVDALLLENMHDTPYLARNVGPEIISCMTAVALKVRSVAPDLPCGIQILAGANQAAMAVALAADLQFIRAEGFVFGHLADEGWMNSDAAELLRYRKMIGAEDILVFTDIKKKHSAHALTADVDLAETAKAAAFFRTDGLIVTGSATGKATKKEELEMVKAICPALPLLVGSGITPQNIANYRNCCDGFIVGSALKHDGYWENELDPNRVLALVSAARA